MDKNPYAPPTAVVADAPSAVAPVRPPAVTWAVRLLWLGFLIGIPDAVREMFTGEIPPEMNRTMIIVIYAVVYLLIFALMYWFNGAIGKGKNWARMVSTVLMTINLLIIFWLLAKFPWATLKATMDAQGVNGVLYLLQVALYLAAVVLLFTPASSAWYGACREARRAASAG
jgi:hypothetical protein